MSEAYQRYCAFKDQIVQQDAQLTNDVRGIPVSEGMSRAIAECKTRLLSAAQDAMRFIGDIPQLVEVAEVVDAWDADSVVRESNLLLDQARVMNLDGALDDDSHYRPTWNDMTKLTSTLNSLKFKGYLSVREIKVLEKVSDQLPKACLESRELQRIGDALSTKLTEEMEQYGLGQELARYEQVLIDLAPEVDNCENLFEASCLSGDVAVAEDIAYNQLALQEKMLKLVQEQYPAIQHKQADAKEFRRHRRWAIFRTAASDINGVAELKNRQIEACEDDLQRLEAYTRERRTALEQDEQRMEVDRHESLAYLKSNAKDQERVWGDIEQLRLEVARKEAEMVALQEKRSNEIANIFEREEAYAEQRSMTTSFLKGAQGYLDRLRFTLDSATLARDLCVTLQDFMLGGAATLESKFEKMDQSLGELETRVDKQFLKHVTSYYLNMARLIYRKSTKVKQVQDELDNTQVKLEFCVDSLDPMAKRHAQRKQELLALKRSIDQETDLLNRKLDDTRNAWQPVSARLRALGVPFADPEELAFKATTQRHQNILRMREVMNVTDDKVGSALQVEATTIQHDREELRLRILRSKDTKKTVAVLNSNRAPRPPQSASEQAQSKAFQRYTQIVSDLKLSESSPILKDVKTASQSHAKEQRHQAGVRTLDEIIVRTTTPGLASSPTVGKKSTPDPMSRLTTAATPSSASDVSALLGKNLVARFTYKARAADELSFVKGDTIVCVLQAPEEGWLVGVSNQRTGLFPFNYVDVAEGDEFDF